ncbi:MAG TPA: right-handed parallel beta-helix repeat-containing protein [Gaiellaceae bacterium]|nr:right-handed parallel beta-helix repeat-containing protein [Gaiellaceae bacterium]
MLTIVVLAAASAAEPAASKTIRVRNDKQLQAAVSKLANSGGTIRLLPNHYRSLVVRPRSGRPLRIVGRPGVRIERILFDRTKRVSLSRVRISPRAEHAIVEVNHSKDIDLDRLTVSAWGTRLSASVTAWASRNVRIRRSNFTHCGDRSVEWSNCLMLFRRTQHITVEDNWFHDCYGCDFIHGRFGSNVTIRRNRFERALPCNFRVLGRVRCMHQDLIQLFAGKLLRVERNHFGVYKYGGAQLSLTGPVDNVSIANNVFVGTDPRVPGYRSRMALIIGAKGSDRLPRFVEVVNNTILTGCERIDGYEGSLRISRAYRYGGYSRRERPLMANNVISVLRTWGRVCFGARGSIANVIVRGHRCSRSDQVGPANLDRRGRPTARSRLLIDRANRSHAPGYDMTGRRRAGAPDIGAYEHDPN